MAVGGLYNTGVWSANTLCLAVYRSQAGAGAESTVRSKLSTKLKTRRNTGRQNCKRKGLPCTSAAGRKSRLTLLIGTPDED